MHIQKLADVQNAVAGGKCTVLIPAGPTIDAIRLRFAGVDATVARIKNIRFNLNGKPVREYLDAADLDEVNKFYAHDAMPATPIDVYFPFRRIEVQAAGALSTIDAERLTALRTGNAGPMSLQFDLDALYASASAANIIAEAIIAPGGPQAMGLMTFTRRTSYNPGGAGKFPINDIPRVGRVVAHHIIKADCNTVTVKRRLAGGPREILWDEATKTGIQEDQDQNGRVPVAGRTVIDYCNNGNLDESVALVDKDGRPAAEYELTLDLASGGPFDILTEYLGTPADF